MEISEQLKNFIKKYSKEIDANEWKDIYTSEDWIDMSPTSNGQFTEIIYQAGIDPLNYMENVPRYFLIQSSIKGKFTITNHITSIGDSAFQNCIGLKRITYQGTKEQWNAVSKASHWDSNTGSYTVYCIDGDIEKK